MKLTKLFTKPEIALLGCLLAAAGLSGCQTTIGGQTLPSAWFLRDDVQYFPAGPEFQLSNQVRAIEEYKAAQEGLADDLGEEPPGPIAPGP
ncbi:hypothetical protein [Maioricimonas sp. JC845]|uniref:hypothetical protein n=1 Tax=Maioricimonas sp. JC845 TaxID=3232138 RepID=UPI0034587946